MDAGDTLIALTLLHLKLGSSPVGGPPSSAPSDGFLLPGYCSGNMVIAVTTPYVLPDEMIWYFHIDMI